MLLLKDRRRPCLLSASLVCLVAAACTMGLTGCAQGDKRPPIVSRYKDQGPKEKVPLYLKNSVYEKADLENADPYPVSGFGLVGQLRGTGDSTAPTPVRQFMVREMLKRGFGSRLVPGFEDFGPDDVLKSKAFAIVRVDGAIPPGARKGDWFDAYVSTLSHPNTTTSLSRGTLFETDLKVDGANPQSPSSAIQVLARCKGPVMVNPAYALDDGDQPTGAARTSLRRGTVMYNALVMQDRPLLLQVRQPQRSVSRAIENRINERFQRDLDRNRTNGQPGIAEAIDEGIVHVYMPKRFKGDWEHFSGVVTHLFFDGSAEFSAVKAKILVAEALKPDAALQDISYCWEGLGTPALPFITPLLSSDNAEVAFAAARAAAFIGDSGGGATETLMRMARTANHPFQITAIQTLGALPGSTSLNHLLRQLLDAEQTLVRIEAYKVLADHKDPSVFSRLVTQKDQKFYLDIVPSSGPAIVYASQRGVPRVAVIGRSAALRLPLTFTAMDKRLSISSAATGDTLTIYHRDAFLPEPVKMYTKPDLAEIAARLGGEGAVGEARLNLTYGEVIAVLQRLTENGQVASRAPTGRVTRAAFYLQEAAQLEQEIFTAPVIGGGGRPQQDDPGPVGQAAQGGARQVRATR